MPRSSLDSPPIPKDLREYRIKLWTEVHLLRQDFTRIEELESEVGEMREELDKAKTWARAFGVFLSLCVAGLEAVRRLIPG